jgi:hypothetical protein
LLHAWGTHVAFVVFQGYREPGIGHSLILGAAPRFGMGPPHGREAVG